MKTWTINEFLTECDALRNNRYTYDYERMPRGTCNGHEVHAYEASWASVVIDGCIINMLYPTYCYKNETMTVLEYMRRLLDAPATAA